MILKKRKLEALQGSWGAKATYGTETGDEAGESGGARHAGPELRGVRWVVHRGAGRPLTAAGAWRDHRH